MQHLSTLSGSTMSDACVQVHTLTIFNECGRPTGTVLARSPFPNEYHARMSLPQLIEDFFHDFGHNEDDVVSTEAVNDPSRRYWEFHAESEKSAATLLLWITTPNSRGFAHSMVTRRPTFE